MTAVAGPLAPCVFCLGHNTVVTWDSSTGTYYILCRDCKARGPAKSSFAAARRDWDAAYERLRHYINQMGRWVKENKR